MSEAKFVVGQWVRHFDGTIKKWDDTRSYGEGREWDWKPFLWQVGRTYRTTIDGVTATITRTSGEVLECLVNEGEYAGAGAAWCAYTGVAYPNAKKPGLYKDFPDLLPYLADEPPPVAEAATFSEFADADESDDEPDALQSLLAEFVQERNLCDEQIATWQLKLAEWKVAVRKVEQAIEKAKR